MAKRGRPRGKTKAKSTDDAGSSSIKKGGAVKVISTAEFDRLVHKCRVGQRALAAERSSLGGVIGDAVDKHLHKGAFGVFRKLDQMETVKRAELLFHFDVYRERSDWDAEPDMFREDVSEPTEAQPEQHRAAGIGGEEIDKLLGLSDGDDNKDLRPNFLRTGGVAPTEPPNGDPPSN